MSYKKFYYSLLLIVIFNILFVYPAIFLLQINVPTEKSRYLDEWWNKKESYSKSINGKKVLFISGSNTLFSINTHEFEKETSVPAVNFGVHAGLGLEYILHRVKSHINEGDIVVLPLEYEMYDNVRPFAGEYCSYISSRDSLYFYDMSIYDKYKFIYSMDFKDILDGIREKFIQKDKKIGAYDSRYLNKNGDMTNNLYENRLDNKKLLINMKSKIYNSSEIPSTEFQHCMDKFLNYCNTRNVKVIITWPAFYYDSKVLCNDDLKNIEKIIQYWHHKKNVILLDSYSDNIYKLEYFYDGNYHMNNLGNEYRTQQKINQIKPYL